MLQNAVAGASPPSTGASCSPVRTPREATGEGARLMSPAPGAPPSGLLDSLYKLCYKRNAEIIYKRLSCGPAHAADMAADAVGGHARAI
jgi:hypothetical protein